MSLPRKPAARILLAAAVCALVAGGVLLAVWWRHRVVEKRIESFDSIILRYAKAERIPPQLIRAVIRVESRGDPAAVSNRGAYGLMQVLEPTRDDVLKRVRKDIPRLSLLDPDYNVFIGTTYLRMMLAQFKGDVALALAAYNWGPGNVAKIQREHPNLAGLALIDAYAPDVTRRYCRTIIEDSGVTTVPLTTSP